MGPFGIQELLVILVLFTLGPLSPIAAILITRDAERRGMESLAWGFGTLFLMIVVVPIYLLRNKPQYLASQH